MLRAEGQNDADAQQIICFAFDSFYDADTGRLALPSPEEFSAQVVDALATAPNTSHSIRLKAEELHDDLVQGDIVSVTKDLGCF